MLFKKNELRHLWPFYLSTLVVSITSVVIPFMVLYFRELHFSFFQISILFAGFGISMFLFEVPTGALADNISRKLSVTLGYFLAGIFTILMGIFSNFYIILLIMIFVGISMTLMSGAEEAWVVDNLKAKKSAHLQHDYFVKSMSIRGIGAVAAIIGAIIAKNLSLNLLWYVWGIGFIITGIIFLNTQEYYKPKIIKNNSLKELFLTSKEGFIFALNNKQIFLLILASLFISISSEAHSGWDIFLINLTLPKHALGYVYFFVGVLTALSPFISNYFKKFKINHSLAIVSLLNFITMFVVFFVFSPHFIYGAIAFIAYNCVFSIQYPIEQNYLHKQLKSHNRATIISLKNMITQFVIFIPGLLIGHLMDIIELRIVIGTLGLFSLVAALIYLKLKD